jgi:serine/threonine protein kinase
MTQYNRDSTQEIFLDALELPESERSAFVEKKCFGDPDCIRDVNSLIEAAARSGILDVPVLPLGLNDNLVGTTIEDRYKVERELAPSGMGTVYLAHNLQLPGKFVVIKVLPNTSTKDPDAVKRFKRELKALTLISHPGVVTVIGTNDLKDGKPYIVMEYIDGPALRSQIQTDGMGVKRAAAIIKQIGAAVGHVHDKGILHLDLKPENIMLQLLSDGTDAVKIVDFGIAKIKDSGGATGAVNTAPIGTLAYMSPEQLRSGERITKASDIYSMAVVACEMISGERPQQPEPASQGRWRPKRVELPQGVSANARNLIAQALCFDPKNRPQNAKKFGDELAEVLLKADHNGLKGLRWQARKRWQPITKWLSIVGGILVLAVLSYGIYKYFTSASLPPLQLTSTTQSKGFNYWLTVQRTRDGKDYEAPDKSNGNETFHNGDKFQLNVLSLDSGYLYIFNERPPEEGSTSFRLIYPKRGVNDGSTSVGGNQPIQSDWITFQGPGTDNYWIVWSASPLTELESAKNEAFKHPQAGLTDQNLVKVKEYLKKLDTEVNARASRMSASQEVQVRKRHDIVLTFAEFKHR